MSWEIKSLGECAKFLSGGTPRKSREDYWGGEIPWVSSGEMTESFLTDTSLHVTSAGSSNGTRFVPENTVLAVVRGMSLAKDFRISITKRPMTFNQDIKALECTDEIDSKFLFYALKARKEYIRGLSTEASHGTKKLETDSLKAVKLLVPKTINEQREVAAVASAYDDLIENNRRRIELLEEAARLVYREWFVHFRFPGHEHVKIIDGVPEGWEQMPASEAVDVNPRTAWDKEHSICMVPMAALSETGMSCDRKAFEVRSKAAGVKFRNGDTVFARITPCLENGKTGYVNFLKVGEIACGSTEFIVLRERAVSKYFVYLLSREDNFRQNAIVSMVGSSGRQRVQTSCFDKYNVAVPPKAIADSFDETVAPQFEQIKNLQSQNTQLSKARDLLLPRLMDGRLEV